MSFDTPFFLCIFLPVTVLLSRLCTGHRSKQIFLTAAGLAFYAFWSISGICILLLLALTNYILGRLLMRLPGSRGILAAGVCINLGALLLFRYPASPVSLLGGSYAVFRCISYLADTFRTPELGTRSFGRLLLYVSFFSQSLAGPISRFASFTSIVERPDAMAAGFRRLIVGLGKKLLISVPLSRISDTVFGAQQLSTVLAWLGATAFMLQLYFDFSGYSDMAIGLSWLFGYTAPENFADPYTAVSITDFWRRWHISLSVWFRDYLYIPLGGNRRGRGRTALHKLLVFLLCGLWHGFGVTFLLWGLIHGILAAMETLLKFPGKRFQSSSLGRTVSRVYTLTAVCLSFVLFRAEHLQDAVHMYTAMFGMGEQTVTAAVLLKQLLSGSSIAALLCAVFLCTPVERRIAAWEQAHPGMTPFLDAAALILLMVCIASLPAAGYHPFLYLGF